MFKYSILSSILLFNVSCFAGGGDLRQEEFEDYFGTGLKVVQTTVDSSFKSYQLDDQGGLNSVRGYQQIEPEFVKDVVASQRDVRVLEIGAAKGFTAHRVAQASRKSSQTGKVQYVMCEKDPQSASVLSTLKPNGRITPELHGEFSEHLIRNSQITRRPYDFIFAGKVLHFLHPSDFFCALQLLNKNLKMGGKLYLTLDTLIFPASDPVRVGFEERRREGQFFPGYCSSLETLAAEFTCSFMAANVNNAVTFGDSFDFMMEHPNGPYPLLPLPHYHDAASMRKLLKFFGFCVEKSQLCMDAYDDNFLPYVGCIATKTSEVDTPKFMRTLPQIEKEGREAFERTAVSQEWSSVLMRNRVYFNRLEFIKTLRDAADKKRQSNPLT